MNIISEFINWFLPTKSNEQFFSKLQEENKANLCLADSFKCYKYCVDTHKYNIIGHIVDGEVVFGKAYPLRDNHILRAYQYAFFIQIDGSYRTFTPKNIVKQVRYDESTSYVIGFMLEDSDEVFYYDQYLIQGD